MTEGCRVFITSSSQSMLRKLQDGTGRVSHSTPMPRNHMAPGPFGLRTCKARNCNFPVICWISIGKFKLNLIELRV